MHFYLDCSNGKLSTDEITFVNSGYGFIYELNGGNGGLGAELLMVGEINGNWYNFSYYTDYEDMDFTGTFYNEDGREVQVTYIYGKDGSVKDCCYYYTDNRSDKTYIDADGNPI